MLRFRGEMRPPALLAPCDTGHQSLAPCRQWPCLATSSDENPSSQSRGSAQDAHPSARVKGGHVDTEMHLTEKGFLSYL